MSQAQEQDYQEIEKVKGLLEEAMEIESLIKEVQLQEQSKEESQNANSRFSQQIKIVTHEFGMQTELQSEQHPEEFQADEWQSNVDEKVIFAKVATMIKTVEGVKLGSFSLAISEQNSVLSQTQSPPETVVV